jgi:hypothetical protein
MRGGGSRLSWAAIQLVLVTINAVVFTDQPCSACKVGFSASSVKFPITSFFGSSKVASVVCVTVLG